MLCPNQFVHEANVLSGRISSILCDDKSAVCGDHSDFNLIKSL